MDTLIDRINTLTLEEAMEAALALRDSSGRVRSSSLWIDPVHVSNSRLLTESGMHPRADVVIPNQNCGSGRCARLVSGSRRRVSTVHSLDFLESCLQIVPSPVGREKVIAAGMSCRRALFD